MKNKDIKKMLAEDAEFVPSEDVKNRILQDSKAIQIEPKKQIKRVPLMKMVAIAASFIIIACLAFTGVGLYYEDYTQVYLDVNPSVTIVMNRFGVVNKVEYLNEDTQKCLDKIRLKGKHSDKAITLIVEELGKNGYLDNAEMFISGYSKNKKNTEKQINEVQAQIEKCKNQNGYSFGVNCGKIDKTEKNEAKKLGLSPMKYSLIKSIIELDNSYTLNSLKNYSMKQLKDLLFSLQK